MIELRKVCFTYGKGEQKSGLRDINLKIHKGELVLLCGESGCGKTTLTRCINGLIPHYYEGSLTGTVCINGKEISRMPIHETARVVGSVFQNPRSQFFNVDTTSELAFGCENMGFPEEEINMRMAEAVADFTIHNLMDRNIFKLSGGEKQKLACASVSATGPDILVLDEPSSNLDSKAVEDLRRALKTWKKKGKTIIIAEHRLYYLRDLVDRTILLENGAIIKEFTSREIVTLQQKQTEQLGLRPFHLPSSTKVVPLEPERDETLDLTGFTYSYRGATPAVAVDSLQIPKGSISAMIGLNGAGKSTFARCFCGLEERFKGIVKDNNGLWRNKDRLRRCYMVMQDANHQLFTESVLDEVLLSMKKPDTAAAENVLLDLDLLPLKDLHPMALSGGQKQRVAVAGAVASDKEVVFFDEPTSGLDLKHMQYTSTVIRKLQEKGKTIFIITHDYEFILRTCRRVLHFDSGKIIGNYPLDEEGTARLLEFFLIKSREET
ncbi:MAG: ABC transporter ATP-binding protein [Spirochaetales bacterium]|nr:ABC transporter ATP-binding protein [Spirochaetales bacterium]